MTPARRAHPDFRHMLLVHDNDDELVEGIRGFVADGLTSGGDVMVLGTRGRLGLLREVLGAHARLEYGSVEDLYVDPMRTLFNFQRMLEERTEPRVLWATGWRASEPGTDGRSLRVGGATCRCRRPRRTSTRVRRPCRRPRSR